WPTGVATRIYKVCNSLHTFTNTFCFEAPSQSLEYNGVKRHQLNCAKLIECNCKDAAKKLKRGDALHRNVPVTKSKKNAAHAKLEQHS
ncbi:MAG: hypothetical protein ACKPKO_33715, partial [Candidatus Fonsibacter sp.]